jgi:hypothetical protein
LAAGGLLTGCEVVKEFAGTCSTSPPVPHHNYGVVYVDVEVPPQVEAGATFRVRVDSMGATASPGSFGQYSTGTVSVTGPVTPSGNFGVGQGFFGGTPFPVTLEFTATGAPGETIDLAADGASSFFGTFPEGIMLTCSGAGPIVSIPIVEPD